MSDYNLDDYVEVKDRIPIFWEKHPDGRIVTEIQPWKDGEVVCEARLFRAGEPEPCATGWAWEREGEGYVNKTSFLENCETSAIGRALANYGIHGPDGNEPRPSREEMRKATNARPPKRQQQSSGAEAGGLSCPDCGGPIWDNREDDESALNGGRRPNFKCRDRDGCNWASWEDEAETFGSEPEGEDEKEPVNEHRAKLREWFKDAYGEDAGQRMAEFVINCPGIPSNPDKLDAFHLSQMWDLIREHGTDAAEDPKAFVGEQGELV